MDIGDIEINRISPKLFFFLMGGGGLKGVRSGPRGGQPAGVPRQQLGSCVPSGCVAFGGGKQEPNTAKSGKLLRKENDSSSKETSSKKEHRKRLQTTQYL